MPDPDTRPTSPPGYNPERYKPRPLTAGKPPWMKQRGESVQAYSAFMIYLMMEPDKRSMAQTAKDVGKSVSLIHKWAGMWSWTMRVGQYEEHYLLIRLESVAADRDAMWLRQKVISETALNIVEASLWDIIKKIDPATGQLDIDVLKPEALTRLLDTATKIQRMAVLGRAQNADEVAQQNERLTERWGEELAETLNTFMDHMEFGPDQKAQAQKVLTEVILGQAAEQKS